MTQEIRMLGDIRFFHSEIAGDKAEIILKGDLKCGDEYYRNISFLHLSVFAGEFEKGLPTFDSIAVIDEYSNFLPYLKPSRKFRDYLIIEIEKYCEKIPPIIVRFGLSLYANDLKSFSEADSIVWQAKYAVNQLDSKESGAERIARKILLDLGETPGVDLDFCRNSV